ncbi:hypothetical protein KIPB_017021, partial [Kipferlia bialata]
AVEKYSHAGRVEIAILRGIEQKGHLAGSNNIARLLNSFEWRGHVCLVFPKYGATMLDLLRCNKWRGFNLDWTRELT